MATSRYETDQAKPAPPIPIFRPLSGMYAEQLTHIWNQDPRIPTPSSRRAWALARNLNPVSVHNWWYRRRPLAKKLRIKIPKDAYDLDIGNPSLPELSSGEKEHEEQAVKQEEDGQNMDFGNTVYNLSTPSSPCMPGSDDTLVADATMKVIFSDAGWSPPSSVAAEFSPFPPPGSPFLELQNLMLETGTQKDFACKTYLLSPSLTPTATIGRASSVPPLPDYECDEVSKALSNQSTRNSNDSMEYIDFDHVPASPTKIAKLSIASSSTPTEDLQSSAGRIDDSSADAKPKDDTEHISEPSVDSTPTNHTELLQDLVSYLTTSIDPTIKITKGIQPRTYSGARIELSTENVDMSLSAIPFLFRSPDYLSPTSGLSPIFTTSSDYFGFSTVHAGFCLDGSRYSSDGSWDGFCDKSCRCNADSESQYPSGFPAAIPATASVAAGVALSSDFMTGGACCNCCRSTSWIPFSKRLLV